MIQPQTSTAPPRTVQLKYCTNCVMPSTRPRITFDANGVCNACVWAREKRSIVDWAARWEQLQELCENHRARNSRTFDCIVPVSGGKDSSYVAYRMKYELGMNPLAVTVRPPLSFELGDQNLKRFIDVGFDHLHVTPDPMIDRRIAKIAFIEQGRPLLSWITAVQTVVFRLAVVMDIPFVMFGEEGEVEYGGTSALSSKASYDIDESVALYLSGNDPRRFLAEFTEKQLYWWLYPSQDEFRALLLDIAHWSYFEDWDPYKHYLFSKEKAGLQESEDRRVGTYNNFGQTDTSLYDLHCYLMYLKFGFGRCSQDVGIDIRRGAMNRRQGVALVRRYDGEYPEPYIDQYCDYFQMTRDDFEAVLQAHANKELFQKVDGRWQPLFFVE